MKRYLVGLLLILVIGCAPAEVPEASSQEEEPVTKAVVIAPKDPVSEKVKEAVKETLVEEPVVEVAKPEVLLVNGKTVEERIEDAYNDLHKKNSAQRIRDNFPDIEVVFIDVGDSSDFPSEILPFKYYYSKEADKTFNLCNVERTVFICDGKLDVLITNEDMESGKCVITPIYRGVLS